MGDLALYGERKMTVRELADLLGVDPEAIKKHVRETFPGLMQNGIQTYLDEYQITEIKAKMRPTTLVVGAQTDLDMVRKTQEVMNWMADKVKALQEEVNQARPKVAFFDAVAESKDAIDMGEVARVLNITGMGRNTIFAILRGKKILMSNNQPYQEYIDRGYFRLIETSFVVNGETRINLKPVVFQKGLDFIRKVIEAGQD